MCDLCLRSKAEVLDLARSLVFCKQRIGLESNKTRALIVGKLVRSGGLSKMSLVNCQATEPARFYL